MYKVDDILNTEVRSFDGHPTAKQGMSMDRIRFYTDVIFALAKFKEKPLDVTIDLLLSSKKITRLYLSYGQRKKKSAREIAKELSPLLR